mgnify:CR=1 FL=1
MPMVIPHFVFWIKIYWPFVVFIDYFLNNALRIFHSLFHDPFLVHVCLGYSINQRWWIFYKSFRKLIVKTLLELWECLFNGARSAHHSVRPLTSSLAKGYIHYGSWTNLCYPVLIEADMSWFSMLAVCNAVRHQHQHPPGPKNTLNREYLPEWKIRMYLIPHLKIYVFIMPMSLK